MKKLTKKQKQILRISIIGQISLWCLVFIGVCLPQFLSHAKNLEIILMLLYAGVIFGLLMIFSVTFKQIPIKDVKKW